MAARAGNGKRKGPLILADTSAWIEFLHRTGTPAHLRLRELVGRRTLATTEPVAMELLAGAPGGWRAEDLRRLLASCTLLSVSGLADYETAAEVYWACRTQGVTLRNQMDCLIAAVAIRTGARLLHRDPDFELIARHSPLAIDELSV